MSYLEKNLLSSLISNLLLLSNLTLIALYMRVTKTCDSKKKLGIANTTDIAIEPPIVFSIRGISERYSVTSLKSPHFPFIN